MASPFLQSVRSACKLRSFSLRTETTYIHWIRRYIYFNDKRHPIDCGSTEVIAFLSHLAEDRQVSVNTQKVALNALVFLYRHVINRGVTVIDGKGKKDRQTLLAESLLPAIRDQSTVAKELQAADKNVA